MGSRSRLLVIWSPEGPFRSFADPEAGCLAMIADLSRTQVTGKCFEPLGVLVTSPTGEFCDLEINQARFNRVTLQPPIPAPILEGPLVTWFAGEAATLQFDLQQSAALIRFGDRQPEYWFQLSRSGVVLGLCDCEEEVRAIFLTDVVLDPGGTKERAWVEDHAPAE